MTRPLACWHQGVSLLQVIVCTALVTILIVPIAGVILASGQPIGQANGSSFAEADFRRVSRWIGQTIRSGDVISVNRSRTQLRRPAGETTTLRLQRQNLVLEDRAGQSIIANDIQVLRFTSPR